MSPDLLITLVITIIGWVVGGGTGLWLINRKRPAEEEAVMVTALRDERDTARTDLSAARAELDRQRRELSERIQSMEQRISTQEQELRSLQAIVTKEQLETDRLKRENTSLEAEKRSIRDRLSDSETLVENLRGQVMSNTINARLLERQRDEIAKRFGVKQGIAEVRHET